MRNREAEHKSLFWCSLCAHIRMTCVGHQMFERVSSVNRLPGAIDID